MNSQRFPMNARDRAVWEDAEGSLFVPGEDKRGGPHRTTTQMERGILLDYLEGAIRDGVVCYIYTRNAKVSEKTPRAYTFYETQIGGMTNIALELLLTAPYRRSVKMLTKIEKFKAFVTLPRNKLSNVVIEARKLCRFF